MDIMAFKIQTFEEADNHYNLKENRSTAERLDAACYLIGMAFKMKPSAKLHRRIFLKRKHELR
jgi:hypothetical protein